MSLLVVSCGDKVCVADVTTIARSQLTCTNSSLGTSDRTSQSSLVTVSFRLCSIRPSGLQLAKRFWDTAEECREKVSISNLSSVYMIKHTIQLRSSCRVRVDLC